MPLHENPIHTPVSLPLGGGYFGHPHLHSRGKYIAGTIIPAGYLDAPNPILYIA